MTETEKIGEVRNEKGRFDKGTCGRPKGIPNKITRDVRQINQTILEAIDDDKLTEAINKLLDSKPEAVLAYIAKIMPKNMSLDINDGQFIVKIHKEEEDV